MKSLLFIIILSFSVGSLASQTYVGEIILQNNRRIKADRIVVTPDSISYVKYPNIDTHHLDIAEVRMLRVVDGNYALEGIGLGIAGGLAFYLSAARYNEIKLEGAMYAMGIGSVIGLVIGVSTNRVNTIRINRKIDVSFLYNYNYLPYSEVSNLSFLNFQYKF